MSSPLAYHGYTGFWVNWAKGSVLGSTLTLSSRSGSIFLAFLVIFVTYTGSQSWKIARFLLHQRRLRTALTLAEAKLELPQPHPQHDSRDGLYYQEQVVLRNESSDKAAAWEFLYLAFCWRGKTQRPFRHITIPLLLAILHASAWTIAALFVPRVAYTLSPEILIRGEHCGYANWTAPPQKSGQNIFDRKILSDLNDAWIYASSCYVNYTVPLSCMMPIQQFSATEKNVSCPFPGLCLLSGDAAAYSVDSGLISSNIDLGINAPPSDQMFYHRVTTCAPLNTTGYSRRVNATTGSIFPVGDVIEQFFFGPNSDMENVNVTFEFDLTAENNSIARYQVFPVNYSPSTIGHNWLPIPQLNSTDSDLTLFFLSANSVLYTAPVNDPLFAAHRPLNISGIDGTYYQADSPITVLACIDQHEYCMPQADSGQGVQQCTGLSDANTAADSLDNLLLTDAQYDTANRIANSTYYNDIYSIVVSRLGASLNAWSSVIGFEQTVQLPDNQWQLEINSWMAVAYSYLQQNVVQYAAGQNNYDPSLIVPPGSPYEEKMCYNQILRSPSGYTSFSFLGVALIIAAGTVIIVVGNLMEQIAASAWPRKRHLEDRQIGQYCSKVWNLDNKYQLQRMTFEAHSLGHWENSDDKFIPQTLGEEEFKYLAVEAPGPRRSRRSRRFRRSRKVPDNYLNGNGSEDTEIVGK